MVPSIPKINLGAGAWPLDGYLNIDRSYEAGVSDSDHRPSRMNADVYPLPFDDDCLGEVRASHILEHFSHRETVAVVAEWARVLKPGGVLKIAVPDFAIIVEKYAAVRAGNIPHDAYLIAGYLLGGHVDENDHHGAIFDNIGLTTLLENAGLVDITTWESEIEDCASLPVSLNLMGRKPDEALVVAEDGLSNDTASEASPEPREPTEDEVRALMLAKLQEGHPDPRFAHITIPHGEVAPVMTAPRFAATSFMHCALLAFEALGVSMKINGGAFWDQGIERLLEGAVKSGAKYALTLDYDTIFTFKDIQALYGIMEARPDIGALCSLQMKREMPYPLLSMKGDGTGNTVSVPFSVFDPDVTQVTTAHLGLTMIRTSCLANVSKPWFHSIPDAEGGWGDGRKDADIAFWHRFADAGNTLYQANRVVVGHFEQVVTWPDKRLRPLFQYASDYHQHGKPAVTWK